MFILDSLMISGIRWALQTVATAADAEMNDDGALREQLLEAEMRRETGELSDEAFRQTEAKLLARIREIREQREGGSGPLGFTATTSDEPDAGRISVEASLTGDFHPPSPEALRRPGLDEARVSSLSRPGISATTRQPTTRSSGTRRSPSPKIVRRARPVGRARKRRA